jgi:hypothetical protein
MASESFHIRNLRMLVIVLGLIVVLCSVSALAYAFWPLEALREQAPLAPTLFVPP